MSRPLTGAEIVARVKADYEKADSAVVAPSKRALRILTDDQVENLPAPAWLVDGVIPQGSLGVLYGPPGKGKSFVALSLALCIGTARDWFGRRTQQGAGVYIAGEGAAGFGVRLRAWKMAEQFVGNSDVVFIPDSVNLLDGGATLLLDSLDAAGITPRIVVMDTLARMMVGGEENSSRDVGLAINAADRVREATDAAVLILHHTSKAGEVERGSSALRGAADVMIALKDEDGRLSLSCDKMKDGIAFDPIPFELASMGESAVPITDKRSCQYGGPILSPAERETLISLTTAFLDGGATATAWLKATNVQERSFYRARTALVRMGYVNEPRQQKGGHYTLTDSGKARVTDILPHTDRILTDSKQAILTDTATPFRVASRGSDSDDSGRDK